MFRFTRRTRTAESIRFCDGCAEVTTAAQRAEQRYDQARTRSLTLGLHL